LIDLFHNLNTKLVANSSIDTKNSGSTGVVVLATTTKLICASVGDSQVFAYTQNKAAGSSMSYHELTIVHSPEDSKETSRIVRRGGSVRRVVNQHGDLVGPLRVFKGTSKTPGLMMTRSFGDDIGHSVGMNCTPSRLPLTQV
jgi:serine/threonine protein phosphatase PrpC